MPSLSVVLIVRDEAHNLPACLDTVSWADEIVIVDSGSDDATVDIARRHTDNVFVEPDWRGYGAQRQRAQAKATGDWVFMLDADERVTPALRASIEAAVAEDRRDRVYAVPRLSWVFGRFIRHGGWYPDYVPRLYARERTGYSADRVHERLELRDGMRQCTLDGDLLHYTYRDMNHYLVKSAHYAADWAQQRLERGRGATLLQGVTHGIACFLRMYVIRAGFLDGKQGFLLAVLSAHSTFVKYADLWVRTRPSCNDPDEDT